MNNSIKKQNALSTPPFGGRGAYIAPRIEIISLDNDISLQLQSATPPEGPGEGAFAPEFLKTDPFKNQLG